nr:CWF19-like protein 2 [Cherax quadricarinatus]
MSMSFIDFESAREKEKKRQWEREAREAILEKAKNKYEAKERKEVAARQRGEHTWMLSSVESKLDSHKLDKKKKKKEKKERKRKKKEKKLKKSKKSYSSSTTSSDDEDEKEQWVEKSAASGTKTSETVRTRELTASQDGTQEQNSSQIQTKRDSWMEMTSLFGTYSRDEMREREGTSRIKAKEEEEKRKWEADKPGSHARELNPYFKDGGTGLPEQRNKDEVSPAPSSLGLDAAWLRKALKRAEEQAQLEKKSLEEIAAQRWGVWLYILAKFNELLAEAEGRGKKNQTDSWQTKISTNTARSRSRERYKSKNRIRSTSSERKNYGSRERSRNKERISYENSSKEHSRSRERKRSRRKERRHQRCGRYGSSSSSERSGSSSHSDHSEERDKQQKQSSTEGDRSVKGLLRPPEDTYPTKHSSLLSSKFRRPRDEEDTRSTSNLNVKKLSSSNRGWQKKEYKQQLKEREIQSRQRSSSSSSSAESSDSEKQPAGASNKSSEKELPLNVPQVTPEPPTLPQPPTQLTDKEMNELAAKIMKAELTGNDALASKLKTKLEAARAARSSAAAFSEGTSGEQTTEQVVVLTRMENGGKHHFPQEHKRSERSLESCQWCFDNKEMPKHLIVALGTKSYVCLPPHESLTPGHCLIVPIHHVACSVQADEDLWSEIQIFRKSIVKMFNSRGEDCIFFETVKRLKYYPHMALNCVSLPREMGDMAPIYFKKAIMECEAEWAQNKKLVDLKNRDVRKAVPKGLPYFFVDFAMDAGFAHVIEDEQEFPNNFAQEIVGGMLDLDSHLWRKPRRENFDAQRRKVMEFSRWYKEFDPTQDN